MASSLLILIDDIAALLDDVSAMTKVAVKKTSGVLGDDLALNAQQVTGVKADRELPVVWAVAKGSFVNKTILVPLALLISAFAPWLITPLMMLGGLFLCYEGVEKLAHKFLHGKEEADAHHAEVVAQNQAVDVVAADQEKIKGAIRTDFILSAEIIVLTLGSVAGAAMSTQILVVVAMAILMTIGVYGLVAGIVKLDDAGLYLSQKSGAFSRWLGNVLLKGTPWLMRGLSFFGTLAMFLVGGGILAHGIGPLVSWLHEVTLDWGGMVGSITGMVTNLVVGVIAGAIVLAVVTLVQKMRGKQPAH
ncbi:DUF808 domain-containing protein [Brachymonas sp. G13]|uniref:DUF808 domain-containing protein n=1 Tax=Brachymonas wangyanguii TaxID=3130163 RepID=UPI00307E1F5B